ncbi:hypothetical protein BU24DRAFT_416067 [Aaosphaeria arxii CBS 175.79]|uniref:Uncharacterized protein n=1 Tax=Aaosphaeria arxii CBS 175.79 TaxID=1450172 RepID=A0A6A5Y6D0_9PLEO|nr:uncharacterized protein BU24DRAFT_416067 [Aaosphaeria arxii CBS 175.79]KAF2020360.1 hypothetical protein BU24DRAFT_416067 [Aaosphaeria arxii CBS 175.79]
MSEAQQKYSPPRADKNTFATHEDFFQSIESGALTSVDLLRENDRKCAHCWKQYGESDPGLNNAESPVMFKCGHAFGQECMKDLFKLPPKFTVNLKALAFEPGSGGADFADKIRQFIDLQRPRRDPFGRIEYWNSRVDTAPGQEQLLATQSEHIRRICRLLSHELRSRHPSVSNLFGPWVEAIVQLFSRAEKVVRIHFLDNGIVFDALHGSSFAYLMAPSMADDQERERIDNLQRKGVKANNDSNEELLAVVLYEVYDAYLQLRRKSSGAVPSTATNTPSNLQQTLTVVHPESSTCDVVTEDVRIGEHNIGSTHYEIKNPHRFQKVHHLDSSDSESGLPQSEPAPRYMVSLRRTFLGLTDKLDEVDTTAPEDAMIRLSAQKMDSMKAKDIPMAVRSIGWVDRREVRNTCPICKKVLFYIENVIDD